MHSAFNRKNTGQYRGGLLIVFPDSAVVAQMTVNHWVVGSNPTLGAMRYKIEEGTMLYDLHLKMVGWVVGKNKRFLEPHMEWDVEWSSGMTNNYHESDLQIFVNDYLALKKSIIK